MRTVFRGISMAAGIIFVVAMPVTIVGFFIAALLKLSVSPSVWLYAAMVSLAGVILSGFAMLLCDERSDELPEHRRLDDDESD